VSTPRKQAPTLEPLTNEWNTARNTAKGWPQFLESIPRALHDRELARFAGLVRDVTS
jgi:hypothetical protein